MNLPRLWMIMMMLTGALSGYIVASGVGVVFAGATSLPLVGEIWWIPIPMSIFLILFRFTFHQELHGRIIEDDKGKKRS